MPNAQTQDCDLERRQFPRVSVPLRGRLMLSDRSEYTCEIVDVSPGSVFLATPGRARVNERVIAYMNHIGRLEGLVTRIEPDGFALELRNTPRKRAKLVKQLTWLANKDGPNLPEDRRFERVVPQDTVGILTLEDGRQYRCNIVDLSLSGAALETHIRPAIGTSVSLGNVRGQVARHFDGGIAVDFPVVACSHDPIALPG